MHTISTGLRFGYGWFRGALSERKAALPTGCVAVYRMGGIIRPIPRSGKGTFRFRHVAVGCPEAPQKGGQKRMAEKFTMGFPLGFHKIQFRFPQGFPCAEGRVEAVASPVKTAPEM